MLQTPDGSVSLARGFTASAPVAGGVDKALAAEWQQLASLAGEANAFAEPWFVASALAHLRNDETVRLAQVRDATGALVGILPLAGSRSHGRLKIAHTTSWVHPQCYCGVPLIRAGDETGFWLALLGLLDRSDWARGFLGLRAVYADGPAMRGLEAAAKSSGRKLHTAQRYDRAMLASDLDPAAYLEATIRPKKRKELRRQARRLAELGTVAFEKLSPDGPLDEWCGQYLAVEAAGWKGKGGTAIAAEQGWTLFFRETMASAHAQGKLDFFRLTLDGRPIAMLINLRVPPAVWSYKIAYDETLSRYSPGVLIELETIPLLLEDPEIALADSCAIPDHPMIDSLWGERQPIVHVAVMLKGPARRLKFSLCRGFDMCGALIRKKGS